MKIRHGIEIVKINVERTVEKLHLNNPIRIRNEKARNRKVDAAIAENGGRMTDEMWNGTFFGRIMNGQTPEQILGEELTTK